MWCWQDEQLCRLAAGRGAVASSLVAREGDQFMGSGHVVQVAPGIGRYLASPLRKASATRELSSVTLKPIVHAWLPCQSGRWTGSRPRTLERAGFELWVPSVPRTRRNTIRRRFAWLAAMLGIEPPRRAIQEHRPCGWRGPGAARSESWDLPKWP